MTFSSSVLIGESVKKVDLILKKTGSPTGVISVVARKGSDDSVSVTFGTIDAASLTESDQTFSLTAPSSHTFAANDKVLIEWDGTGSDTDRVLIKRRYSTDPGSGFDGSNTRQAHYTTSYSTHLGSDLAGEWFSDGSSAPPPPGTTIYEVAPTNSYLKLATGDLRRFGEWLTTSSVLIGESINKVDIILKKSGNPTGSINVVLRRGTDDSIASTFGSIDASTLTTSDQTFSLTAPSSHTFAANDKVLIEWDGTGSNLDQVLVKRRFSSDPSTGFDGSNTRQIHYVTSYSSHLGSDLAGQWYRGA